MGSEAVESHHPGAATPPRLATIICRWCKAEISVLETEELRIAETVCDKCQVIVQDIIDYNKERSHN
jgi:hypothetical protein